jgi:hypothetical protein
MMGSRWRLAQDRTDPVVRRQHGARIVFFAAVSLDVLCGVMFAVSEHVPIISGMYWSLEEATTVGTGVEPHSTIGKIIKVVVALTVIPLFAATFSIFTTALTATHVQNVEDNIKQHVTSKLEHHLGKGESDG